MQWKEIIRKAPEEHNTNWLKFWGLANVETSRPSIAMAKFTGGIFEMAIFTSKVKVYEPELKHYTTCVQFRTLQQHIPHKLRTNGEVLLFNQFEINLLNAYAIVSGWCSVRRVVEGLVYHRIWLAVIWMYILFKFPHKRNLTLKLTQNCPLYE